MVPVGELLGVVHGLLMHVAIHRARPAGVLAGGDRYPVAAAPHPSHVLEGIYSNWAFRSKAHFCPWSTHSTNISGNSGNKRQNSIDGLFACSENNGNVYSKWGDTVMPNTVSNADY